MAVSSYNLITLRNLNIVSGVQGRTIICGSVVSSTSTDFAKTIDPNVFPGSNSSLEINGQIGSGGPIQVLAGSLAFGTGFSHTITATNNISYTVDGRTVLIQRGNNGASVQIDPNLSNKCVAIENDIKILSNQLSTLVNTSGNNISIPTTVTAPLIFYVNNVDVNGIAAFYINGNTVLNNPFVQAIRIIVDSAVMSAVQLVVINLSGTAISFSYGNMDGAWLASTTGKSKTIWNFNQATSIMFTRNLQGGLLAPYAAVNTNVNIDGMTAVDSLITSAEVREPPIAASSCV